ncbi:MAG: GC-type dockerin domain-anchored protein [Phycisphaerales bacterium JB039]
MRISRQTKRRAAVSCAAAAFVLTAPAGGQCQEPTQVIRLPGGAGPLAMQDDTLVVLLDQLGPTRFFTYRLEAGAWSLVAEGRSDNHGPVVLAGEALAIGRDFGDPMNIQLFRRSGDGWAPAGTLTPPEPADTFAIAMAMSDSALIAGDNRHFDGSAHVYRRDVAGWERQATFESEPRHLDFGAAVAIDGDVAAVAADVDGPDSVVIIYRRSGGVWSSEAEVTVPGANVTNGELVIDGDRLLATTARGGGPGRMYRFDGAAWSLEARLDGARWISERGGRAGGALDPNRALIAAAWRDADIDRSGVLYVHEDAGMEWSLERRLLPFSGDSGPVGGSALAADWIAAGVLLQVRMYHLAEPVGACPPGPPIDTEHGLRIDVQGFLSPQTPQAPVRVSAFFERGAWAFAATHFDAVASEAGWSGPRGVSPGGIAPGTTPGTIMGGLVADVIAGQLQFVSIYADPSNPIEIWEADFATADFTPRIIDISASTYTFLVYPERESSVSEYRVLGIQDPEARIRVWRSSCLADCDGSGALDVMDFLCFQELFDTGNLACDFDEDGLLTLFDFLAFQNEYAGGCP